MLTNTMMNINNRAVLNGVRGNGSRPASQAVIHNPGTTNRNNTRLEDGKSRKGAANAKSAQCHRSQKVAVRRRAIVMRFEPAGLFNGSKSNLHVSQHISSQSAFEEYCFQDSVAYTKEHKSL